MTNLNEKNKITKETETMSNYTNQEVRVTTGRVILHHPHTNQPWSFGDKSNAKYSVMVIIPETEIETLESIKEAVKQVEEFGRKMYSDKINENSICVKPLKEPGHGMTIDTHCMNNYFMVANTEICPIIFNKDKQEVYKTDTELEGHYARVSLSFHPYCYNGNFGVSCKLRNIMAFKEKFDISQYMSNPADDF